MSCQPCCLPQRLELIRRAGTTNAIAWIEVLDQAAPAGTPRQQTLLVRLLMAPAVALDAGNVRIGGGTRIGDVEVTWAGMADGPPAEAEPPLAAMLAALPGAATTLVVRTASNGDFSRYTLHLVAGTTSPISGAPPAGFDPLLAGIEFSFKVECPSEFDCADVAACPPAMQAPPPTIDYLAKDYPGFRRLMLDRLSLLAPGWSERSAAGVGVTLVEMLAYAADQLSYRQDVIATEAYLATARQRVSVRRHARLVDYRLHEGHNARAFVHLPVVGADVPLPARTRLLTRSVGLGPEVAAGSEEDDARRAGALAFETVRDETLQQGLNRLDFHTGGDLGCRLPRGATRCTVKTHATGLQAGDFVLLMEERSPTTFEAADADRTRRHVARITRIERTSDPSGGLFETPAFNGPLDVTELHWDAADALPFALCLGVAERPGQPVSAVLGNVVLVEQGSAPTGYRVPGNAGESLGLVPAAVERYAVEAAGCCGTPQRPPRPVRWRPALSQPALSHGYPLAELLARPLDPEQPARWWTANALRHLHPRDAVPQITLWATPPAGGADDEWFVQGDLLGSLAGDSDFVVEFDDRRTARLRFGDDTNGQRPDPGTHFAAYYRVAAGSAGNVGAGAIAHVVSATSGVFTAVSNLLPAFGGEDEEDLEAARRDAPHAFRTQERAVTAADHEAAAQRRHEVQRAAARFRWTGSWHTAFVAADRRGGAAVDAPFEARLRSHLERFRMAGLDLEVDGPRPVPLDVQLFVCVQPGYARADVQRALAAELSSRVLPDGRLGLFHPDRYSFGEPVFASPIVAAAQAVPGVASVKLERFQRLVRPSSTSLAEGVIRIGRLEIAQLAGDPSFRERGRLVLRMGGGQ
jgi:Baseplate J-like protein